METHEADLEIVGSKAFLSEQLELIERLAATDAPILITGETGVGKELVARTIHARSKRKGHSFAAINSSALPHECFSARPGAEAGGLELPAGGTLFLDDVGDLSEPAQAGVLKLLQCRPEPARASAGMRILAAANINMQSAVDMGKFRSDLFFRLNEFSLHIKPLRERREDIPLLVDYFIARYNKQYSRSVKRISDAALSFLKRYHFPGNVRELRNMIQNAVLMNDRGVIWIEDLPLDIVTRSGGEGGAEMLTIKQVEKRHIQSVLDYAGWNVSRASRVLGITRATLYDKIKTYHLAKA
jgi:DNA-binding NtrC family response regulator